MCSRRDEESIVSLGSYYRNAPIAKPEPRYLTKKRQAKMDAKNERAAREITRKRDKGHCRVPNCRNRAQHLHHIVYRSKSKMNRWATGRLVWLCVDHHRLEHAGVISITGDGDKEIHVIGDTEYLNFRL